MHRRDDLRVGAHHPGLVMLDAVVQAVASHDLARGRQMGPGHGGEEVVLDLVVETAVEVVDHAIAADVACRQHLPIEEVELVQATHHRHALVVGSDHRAQIEAEQRIVHGDEGRGLQRFQDQEE